ncbi:MAG: Coenzyme F420 hydrogenase/dehydrogenase, beta subunit C-terminal domain, partial [Ureaplasma sp.]|nr:Coenzyme F420 hydrogenase/dehydrogenase, beta subunit C-terminal domain [Ureaplasma sp.]
YKDIKKIIKSGGLVLFTGTPCQVGGLKSYLGNEYDNLICVDIVCHGVPSNKIFKSYINKLKNEFSEYQNETGFEFRNCKAWGYAPRMTPNTSNKVLVGVKNAYMYAFDKALIFRKSCYDCKFNGINRVGDITIADFWGVGQFDDPLKHNVSKGVSLVLVNNDKGSSIISSLDKVFKEKREIDEATKLNGNIMRSSTYDNRRDEVIDSFLSNDKTLRQICQEFALIDRTPKALIERILTRINLYFPLKNIYNLLHQWI